MRTRVGDNRESEPRRCRTSHARPSNARTAWRPAEETTPAHDSSASAWRVRRAVIVCQPSPRLILRNAYNDSKAVTWLSERIHVPVVVLPYSVGGTPEAKDLFGLFDDTLNRLLAGVQ